MDEIKFSEPIIVISWAKLMIYQFLPDRRSVPLSSQTFTLQIHSHGITFHCTAFEKAL